MSPERGAFMRRLAEETWGLRRDLLSDGYDLALERLAAHVPMTLHRYPTGEECFTWIVPEKWTCDSARLETLDGRVLFSDADHPLHVMSYSLPFEGRVSRRELLDHLHISPHDPEGVCFAHKYYERDWGLCCTAAQRQALTEEAYRVVIRTRFEPGAVGVGEAVVPGERQESFVLCGHLCHPCQFNDGLSGVVLGLDVIRRLRQGPRPRYTWRMLVLPETIGSAAWLSHHQELIPSLAGGLFLEMLALKRPHALQRSAAGCTVVDKAVEAVVRARDPRAVAADFPGVVLNDERMFNSTGIGVPMLSLSRAVPRTVDRRSFTHYHSSRDTLENADMDGLVASRDLVLEIAAALEALDPESLARPKPAPGEGRGRGQSAVPVPLFQGEIFCSRYKSIEYKRMAPLVFTVPYHLDGRRSAEEIAERSRQPLAAVREFLDILAGEGLVEWRGWVDFSQPFAYHFPAAAAAARPGPTPDHAQTNQGHARAMLHLIQERVFLNAESAPDAVMVRDGERTITYGEMDSATNRLAAFLKEAGVGRGDRVAVCMDKSIEAFKAILAILKADAAYVPLDAAIPRPRLLSILQDCGCRCLVCDRATAEAVRSGMAAVPGTALVTLVPEGERGEEGALWAAGLKIFQDTRPEYHNIGEDLAYIVYTSGSTGRPKGVMIPHRAVIDYADWTTQFFQVTPEDRFSSHAGLYFDLSVFDVYTAFFAGASLVPVPRSASMFPAEFLKFVEGERITIWCSVPSLLTYMAKSGILAKARLPELREVTFCGEVMPGATMRAWMEALPHVRFVNQYGPSETTCASMYFPLGEEPLNDCAAVPIGRPIPNTDVFAVTDQGGPAGPGQSGELHIRGAGNGLGYWNDSERTAQAFRQNPLNHDWPDTVYATGDIVTVRPDGQYEFVERKDHQIKYMGYRVELGEIEAVLNACGFVREVAALGVPTEAAGGVMIVACLSLAGEADADGVKAAVAEKLPGYMVPRKVLLLDELPHNANGKIDRLELARLARESG